MKKFLNRLLYFSSLIDVLFFGLLITYFILDPFKVINKYDSFYKPVEYARVGLNKDYVSTKTYIHNSKEENYNSFIFGNSRSANFRISDWKKYLSPDSRCFHFDANGESLFALEKKIEFLDNRNAPIKNALLVLDSSIFIQDKPREGHLFIISPPLVNNSNLFTFHLTFLKSFFTPKFLLAYIDFKISGRVKPFMKENFLIDEAPMNYDAKTNEVMYDHFEELIKEGTYYTPERMAPFHKRDTFQHYTKALIGESQKALLESIQTIFSKQHTNYRLVINPLYDQKEINPEDLEYLKNLFGKYNVFDFSGINAITNDYRNYYESSHFRPTVCSWIMGEIYKRN